MQSVSEREVFTQDGLAVPWGDTSRERPGGLLTRTEDAIQTNSRTDSP